MSFLRPFYTINNIRNIPSIIRRCYSQNTINLSDPAVQSYLKHLMLQHEDLHTKSRRTPEESKRLFDIKPIVNVLEQRIALYDSIESLKELNKRESEDSEMKKMIKEEAQIYLSRINEIDGELQQILLEPVLSEGGVLLEVTAGAGGQEAMLFARELFELYEAYAGYKGWEVNIASIEKSDLGGVRKASMLIEGYGVPQLMRIEAGVHRVQRIPATEKGGRIHTSTVSVAVLPQPTDIELSIPEKDITIETKRASGAGGQHVNTTDSAVRIVHVPTSTIVECQEGRSQIKNREIAMQKLRTILLQKQIEEQSSKINSERKAQVGSGNRNEKIRTYNYPQDRITEHREGGGTLHSLKSFMEGGEQLEQLQENLLRQQHYQLVVDEINEFIKKYQKDAGNN
ncbi:peptide chain release factor 1-like, mitochondrial [Amyelois transitella]|uniref:peptide chain release factor 1-like, mitochondrial n=1 Tax=Amyelois transitella TaxID=680683 RepID=UPI00298FB08C|nr:peptide chain release factor 1-like, mitochondrial [Amyelois transitella]XP_060806000.1 peptide chain release factor 1-like, mitochondrial [Amyelois transitella]